MKKILYFIVVSTMALGSANVVARMPELSGVADFLAGFWMNGDGQMSRTLLHNPTGVDRRVALLYYNDAELFLGCQLITLSPHDFAEVTPSSLFTTDAVDLLPYLEGEGSLEIRSAPLIDEEPGFEGGLIGYIEIIDGEAKYESGGVTPPPDYNAEGLTLGLTPLFPIDTHYFNIDEKNSFKIDRCLCERIRSLGGKWKLADVFCRIT